MIKDSTHAEIEITEDFGKLIEQEASQDNREGTVAKGTIVMIDHEKGIVLIDVGLKSEGMVPISEFKIGDEEPQLKVGDIIDVFIESFENRAGMTVLSKERAVREESWNKFKDLYERGENVEGVIIGKVKGGFAVDMNGLVAFLPGSQIDVRPISDLSVIMGISQPFRILKMDEQQGNLVVSRKVIMEESMKEEKDEMLSQITPGMIVKGTIKNITDYGAFISIHSPDDRSGALDGLLHKTDISWEKIEHPSTVFSVGQVLDLKVIQYDPEKQRISLGLKQLSANPWSAIKDKYVVGGKYDGKISMIVDYGAFITLEKDVDGLVYHTEIDWIAKNVHPKKLLEQDQKVEVVVLDIDVDKHRISLSIKRCAENPWSIMQQTMPVGTIMNAIVKTVCDFGLFVVDEKFNNDTSINILIPSAELSWHMRGEEALQQYSKDDKLQCIITNIDVTYERVTASIRKLHEDDMDKKIAEIIALESVTGKVKLVKRDEVIIVFDKFQVSIDKNEFPRNDDALRFSNVKQGDSIEYKVLLFDKEFKGFIGSIKALENANSKNIMDKMSSSSNKSTSFGELMSSAIDEENK